MNKTAISVTLAGENLLWLKARARARGRRSVSAALDELLTEARKGPAQGRSVVGRVRIVGGDAGLARGEAELRVSFEESLRGAGARSRRRG